ncbi:MAG: hypothetical protein IPM34_11055 [Saprospiraceae bacterium]|nr:hypothetical protein [Saprospiraceae bacterium]
MLTNRDVTPQWEHMSEQLQSAYEDEIFDEKIRKVLNNAQVQHQQLNWDVLDQKIKMQAGRKRKIITARIIESTLFLLILWTLDNIGIGNMIQEHIQIQHQPLAFEEKINANSKYPLANITTNQTSFGLIPSGQIDPNSSSLKDDISSSNPISARAVPNKSSGISSPIDRNQFTSVSISGINEHEYSTKNISYSTPNGIYHYDKFMSLLTTFHRNNIIEFKIPGTLRTPEELELPIHADGVNLLVSSEPDFPELIKQIKPSQLNYSKSVGLFTGAMVNVIQSPSFIQPDVNYTQAQFAHQLGLKVDFHHGPWTLKTGIAYQHINYQPNFSETLGSFEGGYFKIHFKELEAHLVSVPSCLK